MANMVNYGADYTHRVTLRLNEEQFQHLVEMSDMLGVTPSEYLRMGLNASLYASKKLDNKLKEGSTSNENVKTNIYNQL